MLQQLGGAIGAAQHDTLSRLLRHLFLPAAHLCPPRHTSYIWLRLSEAHAEQPPNAAAPQPTANAEAAPEGYAEGEFGEHEFDTAESDDDFSDLVDDEADDEFAHASEDEDNAVAKLLRCSHLGFYAVPDPDTDDADSLWADARQRQGDFQLLHRLRKFKTPVDVFDSACPLFAGLQRGTNDCVSLPPAMRSTVLPPLLAAARHVQAAWAATQGPWSLRAAYAFLTEHDGAALIRECGTTATGLALDAIIVWQRYVKGVYRACTRAVDEHSEGSDGEAAAAQAGAADEAGPSTSSAVESQASVLQRTVAETVILCATNATSLWPVMYCDCIQCTCRCSCFLMTSSCGLQCQCPACCTSEHSCGRAAWRTGGNAALVLLLSTCAYFSRP